MSRRRTTLTVIGFAATLAVLLFAYLPLIQTIPNGSTSYFMDDVGETQVVLNRWGTLHATGYPLYVMIGSTLVAFLRAFGVNAATAPALVSLFWGLITITLIYVLALHFTRRPFLAAGMTILFGLTRTMWIHNDIAEVYTMTLCLLVLMYVVAFWTPAIPGRIFWLAFLGGVGVAHHRALIFSAPALIFAVWEDFVALIRKRPIMILALVGLGLLGLIPYLYLYFRAQAGATWVYGSPGTLQGLLDQFLGKEADHYIGLPSSLSGLAAGFNLVNGVIITDLTIPGIIVGLIGLIVGVFTHRRVALTLILSGGVCYFFHALLYHDILSALILTTTLSLAFGWLFLAEWLLDASRGLRPSPRPIADRAGLRPAASPQPRVCTYALALVLLIGTLVFAADLYNTNAPFIRTLTTDPTGEQTIAMAEHTPPGATLMLAWGSRYFAVGFARDVLGMLPGLRLVDHKADYKKILQTGMLVTPSFTFYNQPISWWEDQIGVPVYLRAVAPDLVQIDTQPELENDPDQPAGVIEEEAHKIDCMVDKLVLHVAWHTQDKPTQDLSVFVHLLDSSGTMIAQDDHSAPVYGWRPLTSWLPQEVVSDVYSLPRSANAATISYGLYDQRADGSFDNVVTYTLPVECGG